MAEPHDHAPSGHALVAMPDDLCIDQRWDCNLETKTFSTTDPVVLKRDEDIRISKEETALITDPEAAALAAEKGGESK